MYKTMTHRSPMHHMSLKHHHLLLNVYLQQFLSCYNEFSFSINIIQINKIE